MNNFGEIMLKEIFEQPQAIKNIIEKESENIKAIFKDFKPKNIVIAARGTSDHAGIYGKYLFEVYAGIPVAFAAPSVVTVYDSKLSYSPDTLVIGISQSGAAADAIAIMDQAKADGAKVMAITNNADSPMAKAADITILLHAGKENAVAATKTYTTTMMALLMMAASISENDKLFTAADKVPALLDDVLKNSDDIANIAHHCRYITEMVILGRGFDLTLAFEAAVKLRETCYIKTQQFASPDFIHGPIAILNFNDPVLYFANKGKVSKSNIEFINRIKQTGAEMMVIGNDQDVLDLANVKVGVNLDFDVDEAVAVFPAIVAAHILIQRLAVIRHINPDAPRGLSKVTITR
jgi:glucosamine--fructose-6-phosphate aminotransferase (isomerizing)